MVSRRSLGRRRVSSTSTWTRTASHGRARSRSMEMSRPRWRRWPPPSGGGPERAAWLAKLREADAAARRRDEVMTRSDSSPVHPARLIAEVDAFCDGDAIVVGEGGDFV